MGKNTWYENERIDLLTKYPKSHIFMSKQIVLPAFYRDISSTSGGGGETSPVNNMYTKLIRLSSLLDEDSMFDFTFNNTNYTIQKTIVEIYNYFKEKLHKKSGLFRKYLFKLAADLLVRATHFNTDRLRLDRVAVAVTQQGIEQYGFAGAIRIRGPNTKNCSGCACGPLRY